MMFLEKIPVSPNGKVDRKSLPEPSHERPQTNTHFAPPTTELEKELVELYQQVLELEGLGIRDHFFDIGGNSLTAVFLMNHIETHVGRKFPLDIIFDHSTVEELAREIERRLAEEVNNYK
jgi:acyl carrier protein